MIAGFLLAAAVQALAPSGPVVVHEEVSEVLVVAGDVRVAGTVQGNVVVVFGDVILQPGASVGGDVVVLGGSLLGQGQITGRKVVVGGRGARGPWVWEVTLLRWGLWLVVTFLLLWWAPFSVRGIGEGVGQGPGENMAMGVVVIFGWVALMLLLGGITSGGMRLFLWLVLALALMAVKALGVVGVFWMVGKHLRLFLLQALRGELPRTGVAALSLLLLSGLPWVGEALWLGVNLLGLGSVTFLWLPHIAPSLSHSAERRNGLPV